MTRTFEQLVDEAAEVSVDGWDFSWLNGRAREQRPSWGYQRTLAARLATVDSVLDIETGGGEVLAGTGVVPRLAVATESWPPNVARASALLHPRGVAVVAVVGPPLPFADGSFELVTSRHPVAPWWSEIARVLRPGGSYLAQHVGPASVFELVEHFLGPQPEEVRSRRSPELDRAAAEAAGLEIVDLRLERLRTEFDDIGAVAYFLRKVVWMVPGFTIEAYRDALRKLHKRIESEGPFVATATRFLIEARKPA